METGRLASSACNTETGHFIAVATAEKRKVLTNWRYAKFVAQAPLAIVVCGDKKGSDNGYIVNASLALENMVLVAVNEGRGTWVVSSFNEKDIKAILKIPDNFEAIAMIAIGYTGEEMNLSIKLVHLVRSRKFLTEIASEE